MYSEMINQAKKLSGEMSENYKQLHKIAEAGMQLHKTVAFCRAKLEEMGFQPKDCAGGLLAEAGRGERCVLLRADMDALPIREETGLDFAAENGNMHACGHDMHTAMLLGAAHLLKERENELSGKVKLCFQPGEELLSGAKNMIEAGLLRDPAPNCALMIHVLTATDRKTGTVIIPPAGVGASGADFFKVTVGGKGCHGSTPHLGRDPIAAMSHILTTLFPLTAKELKGGEGDVLTVGKISAGEAANAIPEKGELFGTIRSYSDENRAYLKKRLSEICAAVAAAHRCSATVEYTAGAPPFINDPSVRDMAIKALSEGETDPAILPDGTRGGGSEDFSYVSRKIPSLMLALAAGERSDGFCEPLHSPRSRLDEGAMPYGAAAYAAFAVSFLES